MLALARAPTAARPAPRQARACGLQLRRGRATASASGSACYHATRSADLCCGPAFGPTANRRPPARLAPAASAAPQPTCPHWRSCCQGSSPGCCCVQPTGCRCGPRRGLAPLCAAPHGTGYGTGYPYQLQAGEGGDAGASSRPFYDPTADSFEPLNPLDHMARQSQQLPPVNVQVGLDGRTLQVALPPDATVGALMERLEQMTGTSRDQQRLTVGGRVLGADSRLAEAGVTPQSRIIMITRLRGG